MSRLSLSTALVFSLAIGYYGQNTYAASGSGKGAAASAVNESTTPAAGADIRLRAKFEDPAAEANPALEDTLPEFHAYYRVKKGIAQLQVRVENIELGTVVNVFIQNLKIGTATVEADGAGTEAALDFKKGAWPAGLPTTLTVGMMVRVFSGTILLFEAPFEAK